LASLRLGLCSLQLKEKVWVEYLPDTLTFKSLLLPLQDEEPASERSATIYATLETILDKILSSQPKCIRSVEIRTIFPSPAHRRSHRLPLQIQRKCAEIISKKCLGLEKLAWTVADLEESERSQGKCSGHLFESLLKASCIKSLRCLVVEYEENVFFDNGRLLSSISSGAMPALEELVIHRAGDEFLVYGTYSVVEEFLLEHRGKLKEAMQKVAKTFKQLSIFGSRGVGNERVALEQTFGLELLSDGTQWHRAAEISEENIGITPEKLIISGSTLFSWMVASSLEDPTVDQIKALYSAFFPDLQKYNSAEDRLLQAWLRGEALCQIPPDTQNDFVEWKGQQIDILLPYAHKIMIPSPLSQDQWYCHVPILGAAVRLCIASPTQGNFARLQNILSLNIENLCYLSTMIETSWNDAEDFIDLIPGNLDPQACHALYIQAAEKYQHKISCSLWAAVLKRRLSEESFEKFVEFVWILTGGKLSEEAIEFISYEERSQRNPGQPSDGAKLRQKFKNLIRKLEIGERQI
jgi:hypothetical protein